MHYPESNLSVTNNRAPSKALEIQENNLKPNKQSASDNVSSAIETATEGANAARAASVEPRQIRDH